jgi:hypothetical protein
VCGTNIDVELPIESATMGVDGGEQIDDCDHRGE